MVFIEIFNIFKPLIIPCMFFVIFIFILGCAFEFLGVFIREKFFK